MENEALQGQCRLGEYLEIVENLEADAFFLFTEGIMTKVQKQIFSFENNGEQLNFLNGDMHL